MRRTALAPLSPRYKSMALGVGDPTFITSDTVPAPVGGWDTLSPLANMAPDHAVLLDNWIPRPGWVEVRRGTQPFATGVGSATAAVETIMAYNTANTNNDKLFAVAAGTIYNITAGSAASATSITGLNSNRFQYVNFGDNAGNHYIFAANGVDNPQVFYGATSVWGAWSVATTSVVAGVPIAFAQHKGRLWAVPNNATTMLYVNPAGAIGSSVSTFEVGPFMSKGGYVQAIATWSIDTRQTVDDYLTFITSRGQAIVYEGTDPSSANTWALVGVYDLGPTVGRRCFLRVAGDLFIITVDGLIPMSQMLSTDRSAANRVSLTAQIMDTMRQAVQLYGNNFGWQFASYPRGNLGILNVPTATNSASQQYVMNTLTGAWCRFLGINCNVWETFHDIMYIGMNNGTVYQFDTDSADNTTPITATLNAAFNYFKMRGRRKRFVAVKPLLTTDNTVNPGVGVNVDFGNDGVATAPSLSGLAGATWDVSQWDTAVWPVPDIHTHQWQTLTGEGYAASIIVTVNTLKSGNSNGVTLQLNGFDVLMEPGGAL